MMTMDKETKDSLSIEVDKRGMITAQGGQIFPLTLDMDDDNYRQLIENYEGGIMLSLDEGEDAPMIFHGCHWWHGGKFPYMIKKDLKIINFVCGKQSAKAEIITAKAMATQVDKEKDECLWSITFIVRGIVEDPYRHNTYLLRWNPAISSFRMQDLKRAIAQCPDGFRLDWSIYDWKDADEGDEYYMLRVGEGDTGIVFHGMFLSEPYEGDDWAGKGQPRHYVDISCEHASVSPLVPVEALQKSVPEINWLHGHSGELITESQEKIVDKLLYDALLSNDLTTYSK